MFLSFLKGFQLSEIASDLRVGLRVKTARLLKEKCVGTVYNQIN